MPETGTTDTTFISLLGFVVGLLGLSRFKKAHKE
nr:LPXTG cell wall anchor domain-containing protein [Streptococcus anginosus]